MKRIEVIVYSHTGSIIFGRRSHSLGVFTFDDEVYTKLAECLKKVTPIKPYLGTDGKIYPYFEVRELEAE